ncbi:SPOR domain-containing protein [Sporolactobacillus nakayamae]|uniref:Sporulation related domain-containing protein n=1 Tax=Sporolactobacillus nakayamae TaxID=269670 RepID=A0A1I2NQP9_9BACL|nr:SPOR domain-containing protein [Sporolactobacillus nakayamae]SFG05883.1 Sporulation related domain-containing protein [Sporolactobacillus nakayamae]
MSELKKKTPRVTITFNGKKHNLEEWTRQETAADKDKSLNWNAAFSEERTTTEHHTQPVTDDDAFVKQKYSFFRHNKKRRPVLSIPSGTWQTIHHFWLPAVAAIVVGLVIGLSMLMIFSDQNTKVKDTWADNPKKTQSDGASEAVKAVNLNLPVYMIQAGLFGSNSKAKQVAEQLKSKGPAAVMQVSGGSAIFVGVSQTEVGADQLLAHFKKKGMTVFKKQMTIQSDSAAEKSKLKANEALTYKKIISALLSISEKSKNGSAAPDANYLKTVDKLYSSVAKQARSAETDHVFSQVKQTKTIAQNLVSNSSEEHFFAFQQDLLETISEYNALIHP